MNRNVLEEINRSAPTLGHFNTKTVGGFAARLFRQYGTQPVLDALPQTKLSPLESGWIKLQAMEKDRPV